MIIRIFYTKDCKRCHAYLNALTEACINYVALDADEDKNEKICDKYGVDELPYTQILDGKKVIKEFVGIRNPEYFEKYD